MTRTSAAWFAFFRIVFGLYLAVHFAQLVPWAPELFSREGVLGDATLNALPQWPFSPLAWWDTPLFTQVWCGFLAVVAFLFALGWQRRVLAVLLWFGWASLFLRNNLISNPGIPYVGVLLLFTALVPDGEPWRWRGRPVRPSEWGIPTMVFWGAWILLAVGYSFSGYTKLDSPSWVDGTALRHLLENPLARAHALRDFFLGLPPEVLKVLTWCALGAELLFLPLCFFRWGRLVAWTSMVGMHLGILCLVDFADLTLGMLMIHWFVFEQAWLPAPRRTEPALLLFDGECGLCQAVVRFLLREDTDERLRFAPLQSPLGQARLRSLGLNTQDFDSLVFFPRPTTAPLDALQRTDAVIAALDELGGWGRLAQGLRPWPRALRDLGYVGVARLRYRLFGHYRPTPWPEPSWATRVLERDGPVL